MRVPTSASGSEVTTENRDTEAIAGSASPRNPRVAMVDSPSRSRSLLVACRVIACTASSRDIP